MGRVYFLIFWIPAIASGILLLFAIAGDLVRRPVVPVLWFGVALLTQVTSGLFSPRWVVGLVLQVILAVYLALRVKVG